MNKTRRQIPQDLRSRFIQLLKGLRREAGDTREDDLWEIASRLLHADVMLEWEHFKGDIGIYASEDIINGFDADDPYNGEWGI